MRTCVGCRRRGEKSELVRVVASGGALSLDLRQTAPGRGAYVHPLGACIVAAERRRVWQRALRVSGFLDTSAIKALAAPVASE